MSGAIVETQGLTVYYGKHRGIVDVDLSVEQGEVRLLPAVGCVDPDLGDTNMRRDAERVGAGNDTKPEQMSEAVLPWAKTCRTSQGGTGGTDAGDLGGRGDGPLRLRRCRPSRRCGQGPKRC